MKSLLEESFGGIFEASLLYDITENARFVEADHGTVLIDIGQYVKGMPLLISGALKVLREDEEGDELLLYYLERGDTCSMTMACCLGNTKSEIRAVAETDVQLVMVPVGKMEEWMGKYQTWRSFVFQSYHNRLNELLVTVDSIAFKNMDERLIAYLKERARVSNSSEIKSTHQEIAYDLHTSRVVVSRLLKKLEHLGRIRLHRNQIELFNL